MKQRLRANKDLILIISIFILIFGFFIYSLYDNSKDTYNSEEIEEYIIESPEEIETKISEGLDKEIIDIEEENSEIVSTYPHFNTKNITYALSGDVKSSKKNEIREALKIMEEIIGEFNFIEVGENENPLIIFNITSSKYYPDTGMEELGYAIPTFDGNLILSGEISISKNTEGACRTQEYPDTVIHEVLHIFGFDHNEETIMATESVRCSKLNHLQNKPYVEHLKYIYSNGERGKEHSDIPYTPYY